MKLHNQANGSLVSQDDYNKIFTLFKEYDLRGNDSSLLCEEVYYLCGKALVEKVIKPQQLPLKVVVGMDGRLNSVDYYNAFCAGVRSAGAEVIGIGLAATEIVYAGSMLNNCSGAMVTASHNPKEDNGLKLVKAIPYMMGLNSGLDMLRDFTIEALKYGFVLPNFELEGENNLAKKAIIDYWLEKYSEICEVRKIDEITENKKIKIVVDTANGMGGFLMEKLKNIYRNIEFIPLYWDIDGNFPSHPANPAIKENLVDLEKAVLGNNADLGAAFDGDGDRVFFVNEKGEAMNNEFVCALFTKHMINATNENPALASFNNAIVYVNSYSTATLDTIIAAGSVAIPCKQGHTFVKEKMKKWNAVYGCEATGHNYFGSFNYMDSGALTLGLMVDILAKTICTDGKKASDLLQYWSKLYFVSGEKNIRLPEDLKIEGIIERLQGVYSDALFWLEDGITGYFPNWKFSVRLSKTEPIARINIETTIVNDTDNKLNEILKILNLN